MTQSNLAKKLTAGLWAGVGLVILAAAVFLAFILWEPLIAGSQANTGGGPPPPRVQVRRVKLDNVERRIRLPATVEGFKKADLYAKISGYVEAMKVDIGDTVKRGAKLALLKVPEMKKQLDQKKALVKRAAAEIEQAKAAVKEAEAKKNSAEAWHKQVQSEENEKNAQIKYRKKDLERVNQLLSKNLTEMINRDVAELHLEVANADLAAVKARIETAKVKIKEAEALVERAKADEKAAVAQKAVADAEKEQFEELLNYATISAPFAGMISARNVDEGAFVKSADNNSAAIPLLSVTKVDHLRVVIHLPLSDVYWLKNPKATATIEAETIPGKTLTAEVKRSSAAMDMKSRTLRVEVELLNNLDRETGKPKIYPNSYVYANLHLTTHKKVPVIPASALLTSGSKKFVLLVKDKKIERRYVKTLYEDGIIVGIAKGLTGTETIVQTGSSQYAPGMEVVPVLANAAK